MANSVNCSQDLEKELEEESKDVKILFYGHSRIGKTCLAGALINGVSADGDSGPNKGTKVIDKTQYPEGDTNITVYDTPGLSLDTTDCVMEEIAETCHPKHMNCIFVCWPFAGGFDQKSLAALHQLDPEVWDRVIFVLTKCDELPSTYKRKDDETKKTKIAETTEEWRSNFKKALQSFGVEQKILDNLHIVHTTHTEEEKYINWKLYGIHENDYNSQRGLQAAIMRLIINYPPPPPPPSHLVPPHPPSHLPPSHLPPPHPPSHLPPPHPLPHPPSHFESKRTSSTRNQLLLFAGGCALGAFAIKTIMPDSIPVLVTLYSSIGIRQIAAHTFTVQVPRFVVAVGGGVIAGAVATTLGTTNK